MQICLFFLLLLSNERKCHHCHSYEAKHDTENHTPEMAGLYIHIPFCQSRCIYCGFYSTTLLDKRQEYTDALCEEMRLRAKPMLGTIYIGGGTPSQLSFGQIRQLFAAIGHHYPISADAEVTMECNPDDISPSFAELLSTLPVNRVSMGIQTFDDHRLRFLHRRHDSKQAIKAVKLLRQSGISNISVDLMFSFPGQTLEEWEKDIDQALSLGVEHISSYSLMIEEGTPLWEMRRSGAIDMPDDDLYVEMYQTLAGRLTSAGYEHYEISNFAKPGHRSRHNSSYWNGTPYIGIGAAAHSYDGESRQWNVSDIGTYITSIQQGVIPCEREELDLSSRYNDMVTTALRTSEGIDLEKARGEFGESLSQYLERQAERWIRTGHIINKNGHIRFSLAGIMLSDTIMSDLVWA